MEYVAELRRRSATAAVARADRSNAGLRKLSGLGLHAMAVDFPKVHGHPNRLPFEGVLTLVDVASDRAPSSLASQYVVVKFGAVVVKGPSYAHYQVLVDR
jgi:hypothetical protein